MHNSHYDLTNHNKYTVSTLYDLVKLNEGLVVAGMVSDVNAIDGQRYQY